MTYVNTLLGFADGSIASVDQITTILGAGFNSVLSGGTGPVATVDPPLSDLLAIPPMLNITLDFGTGCSVPSDSGAATVAGNAVINVTNLVFADTLAGDAAVALNNLRVNGVPVANGNF